MNIKKLVKILSIAGLSLALLVYIFFTVFFVYSVEYYPVRTYQKVWDDKSLWDHYAIGDKRNPMDYGFDYRDEVFPSYQKGLNLNAWYVPAQQDDSSSAILLLHGRTANRLKPMKYLKLVRESGLHQDHAVFLPDMRNSGTSPEARTAMGKEFAKDLYGALLFLRQEYNKKNFVLYTFSMSSMAAMYMLNQDGFAQRLKQRGITIDKIIMDSPLLKVDEVLHHGSVRSGYPSWLTWMSLWAYDLLWFDGDLQGLALSRLYHKLDMPVLLLQGGRDRITPFSVVKREIGRVRDKMANLEVHFFSEAAHVYIYPHKKYNRRYREIVIDFLQKNPRQKNPRQEK